MGARGVATRDSGTASVCREFWGHPGGLNRPWGGSLLGTEGSLWGFRGRHWGLGETHGSPLETQESSPGMLGSQSGTGRSWAQPRIAGMPPGMRVSQPGNLEDEGKPSPPQNIPPQPLQAWTPSFPPFQLFSKLASSFLNACPFP